MWYQRNTEYLILHLYVHPGAKKNEIVGIHEGKLKIRLKAPPIEGGANKELLYYFSKLFQVPLRQVTLIRGDKSRYKMLNIIGSKIDPDTLF